MAKATESGRGTRVDNIAEASLKLAGLIDRGFRLGCYPLVAVGIGTVFMFFYMIAMLPLVNHRCGGRIPRQL